MTNKNLFDDDSNTTKIPNFANGTDGDTNSIDMSIFNMSDEELYDDVPKKKKEATTKSTKRKLNTTAVLCLIICGILLVVSIVCGFYSINVKKQLKDAQDKLTQFEAAVSEKDNQISKLNMDINALNTQIEELKNSGLSPTPNVDPNNKYPSGTKLYITEDGSKQGVRVSASKDAETLTDSDGNNIVLYWGDVATLVEDATKDSNGNYWGKVGKVKADGKEMTVNNGYIRIEWDGEIWATIEEQ